MLDFILFIFILHLIYFLVTLIFVIREICLKKRPGFVFNVGFTFRLALFRIVLVQAGFGKTLPFFLRVSVFAGAEHIEVFSPRRIKWYWLKYKSNKAAEILYNAFVYIKTNIC